MFSYTMLLCVLMHFNYDIYVLLISNFKIKIMKTISLSAIQKILRKYIIENSMQVTMIRPEDIPAISRDIKDLIYKINKSK